MHVQKGGNTEAGAQLERLQAQNGMLQKVSRKLQEEVKLLRTGLSLPTVDSAGHHRSNCLQESPSDETSPSGLPLLVQEISSVQCTRLAGDFSSNDV